MMKKEAVDRPTRSSQETGSGGDQGAPATLSTLASLTVKLLKERDPYHVDSVPSEYDDNQCMTPPKIAKPHWTALGDALRQAEKLSQDSIPGDHWISLRCDGTGFSKLTKAMRKAGVFPEAHGWSLSFADIMVACCRQLMDAFHATCGYTQSDELTVLIAPTRVIRDEQQPRKYGGRVQKLCSLAAATVTAHFNHLVWELCRRNGVAVDNPQQFLATFDCRVGVFSTREQAVSLLLWRAYDCGVNGVSDAVFHCKGRIEGAGPVVRLGQDAKLQWLHQHGLLPLHPHQRAGTYLVKRRCATQAVNRVTGEPVTCLRPRIEQVPGNVLVLCKLDKLFPEDDLLPEGNDDT